MFNNQTLLYICYEDFESERTHPVYKIWSERRWRCHALPVCWNAGMFSNKLGQSLNEETERVK